MSSDVLNVNPVDGALLKAELDDENNKIIVTEDKKKTKGRKENIKK